MTHARLYGSDRPYGMKLFLFVSVHVVHVHAHVHVHVCSLLS